jgi:hypothetical protein
MLAQFLYEKLLFAVEERIVNGVSAKIHSGDNLQGVWPRFE